MKKLLKILPVVMVACFAITSVFAVSIPNASDIQGNASTTITDAATGLWSTVITIVQILAIAAVVFAGLRYMFASADQKADIKKSMGILVIGAILVFGATFILEFIIGAADEVLNK